MADNSRDRYGTLKAPNDRSSDHGEEDPLVELARIVSEDGGFYKPRTRRRRAEETAAPEERLEPELPGPDEETAAFAPELESELLREFEKSHGIEPHRTEEPEREPPRFGNDMDDPDERLDLPAASPEQPHEGQFDGGDPVAAYSDPADDGSSAYHEFADRPAAAAGRGGHEEHGGHYSETDEYLSSQNPELWPPHPLQPVEGPAGHPAQPADEDVRAIGLRLNRDPDPLDAEGEPYRASDDPLASDQADDVDRGFAHGVADRPAARRHHNDDEPKFDEPRFSAPRLDDQFDEPPIGQPDFDESHFDEPQLGGPQFDPLQPSDHDDAANAPEAGVPEEWDDLLGTAASISADPGFEDWPADADAPGDEPVQRREGPVHVAGQDFAIGADPLFTIERPGSMDADDDVEDTSPQLEPLFDSAAAAETDVGEDAYLSDDELFDDEMAEPAPLRARERPRFGPSDFEAPQRSRGSLLAIAAVLAVAIIGGGVAATIGLTSGPSDADEPPVIRADEAAAKVRPTEVASTDDSEGDGSGVFDAVSGRAPKGEEKLIDRIEEPRDVARINLPDDSAGAGGPGALDGDLSGGDSGKIEARMTDDDTSLQGGPRYDPIGPRKVKTVIVRPDGTIVRNPPADDAMDVSDSGPRAADDAGSLLGNLGTGEGAAGETPRAVRVRTVDLNGSGDPVDRAAQIEGDGLGEEIAPGMEIAMLGDPADTEADLTESEADAVENSELLPVSAIPKPKPSEIPDVARSAAPREQAPVRQIVRRREPAPASQRDPERPVDLLAAAPAANDPPAQAPVRAAPAATAGSGYVVQVSSQRSQDAAAATYRDLQRRYPSLLASHEATIQRAEIAGKGTYYRVRVGPWGSKADADQLCAQLKASGGACFVAR